MSHIPFWQGIAHKNMNWASVWRWCNTHGDSIIVWGDKNSTTSKLSELEKLARDELFSLSRFDSNSNSIAHMQSQFVHSIFGTRIYCQLSETGIADFCLQRDKQLGNPFYGSHVWRRSGFTLDVPWLRSVRVGIEQGVGFSYFSIVCAIYGKQCQSKKINAKKIKLNICRRLSERSC